MIKTSTSGNFVNFSRGLYSKSHGIFTTKEFQDECIIQLFAFAVGVNIMTYAWSFEKVLNS